MRLKALLIALLLAGPAVKYLPMDIPFNLCATLDPDGWLYWALGCGKDSSGGGGSGAGQM